MTWLFALVNLMRLAVLWLRVRLGRPLPAAAMMGLTWLDRWAASLQRGPR